MDDILEHCYFQYREQIVNNIEKELLDCDPCVKN